MTLVEKIRACHEALAAAAIPHAFGGALALSAPAALAAFSPVPAAVALDAAALDVPGAALASEEAAAAAEPPSQSECN